MKFFGPLIVVSDMERSKAFYKKHLDLDVEIDFGANVTLTGGIALQTHWNTVTLGGDVQEDELKRMIEQSYDLIKPKMKRGMNSNDEKS